MKQILISFVFILSGLLSHAQIRPPQQTDTLIITSLKYNYADIREENWPCSMILKSTTSFRFGEDEFTILSASGFGSVVEFVVTDKNNEYSYSLTYKEYPEDIYVIFSGYEFICQKISNAEPEQFERTYTANAVLVGRNVEGKLPTVSYYKKGKIVVDIWVDNYGSVQKAVAGVDGTTVSDKELWNRARSAAMKTCFSMNADAPAMQKGTITYFSDEDMDREYAIPFQLVEEKPTFRGEDSDEFSRWVNQRLEYPKNAKQNFIQGRVTLTFTVAKDGSVKDVEVLKSANEYLDQEAVRVVSSSPKWTPGRIDGQPVAVKYTFPVIFQLR